jgi:thiamine biosynthesis lipoprotein
VQVFDTSIVTSGVYERYFEADGYRYHHLLSTENGCPVNNGLLSVTILTASSIKADALSTVVFTLGFEQGRALIDSTPDAEAIFIFDDKRVHITDGLTGIFRLTNDDFSIF